MFWTALLSTCISFAQESAELPLSSSADRLVQRFNDVAPYLNGQDAAAQMRLKDECSTFGRRCLDFLRAEPRLAKAALPDNPEYWARYAAMLQAQVAQRSIEWVQSNPHRRVIDAANGWALHQILIRGEIDLEVLHAHVTAHRQQLADAEFLLHKMVFTVSTSIMLSAVNLYMAESLVDPANEARILLDDMLDPLTDAELSLRKAMNGELRHAESQSDALADYDRDQQRDLQRIYAYVSDRSEVSWQAYWEHGLDIRRDIPAVANGVWFPAWGLDGTLILARALRELYAGRVSPGPPMVPPPWGWSWHWRQKPQALCLEARDVHWALHVDQPLCLEYLADGTGD
jgi:hypothetical protein